MDEMGPVAAKSYPGHQLTRARPQAEPRRPAQRARKEIDNGRRDKGYVFGAFRPVSGEALTKTYGDMIEMGILDPLKVVRVALQNAASRAGLMLTMETVITELKEKEKAAVGATA